MLPPEKQQEVLMQLMQKSQQFALGGNAQSVPVEAERNETITTQDGQEPQVEGGYLEQKSYNPVTGQATYEIPDNEHSETHETGGVNMQLSEGDVVNSDKTKIPTDFKVYGKNFKGKTFKEASDYLAKQETKIQNDFAQKVKEGKTDKVSDGALQIMLAKLGKNRDGLNELQQQVLESKKQNETNEAIKSGLAEYGKVVLEMDKAKEGLNVTLDRYINYKITEKPVVKAAEGLNASIDKFSKFADKVTSNPNSSLQDIMSAYKQSGLSFNPKESTSYYKPTFQPINGSQIVGDFKTKIAQKETGAYKNPYIAIAGIDEKDASSHSFDELKSKAASSGIGKYQFLWKLHKGDIKRITGISKPDDFRYNPEAQEKFMDWFRDNKLLPQATELKQKYELPMSIDQIMAMTHLEGKAGLEKKIKSGTLKTSTMANNFKNASPLDYASKFKEGGKAKSGVWNNFENIPYHIENDYPNKQDIQMQMGTDTLSNLSPEEIQQKASKTNLSLKDEEIYLSDNLAWQYKNGKFNQYYSPQKIKQALDFASYHNSQEEAYNEGMSTYKYKYLEDQTRRMYNRSKFVPQSEYKYGGYAKDGFNFSTWQGDKVIPGLNKADYTADDLSFIAKTYFPNQQFKSNKELQEAIVPYLDENFGGYQNYVKPITPFADKKTPLPGALYDDKFGDDWSAAIKLLKENSPVSVPVPDFKFDPYITKDINDVPIDNRNDLNRSKLRIPSDNEEVIDENQITAPTTQGDKTSWMDKLKYGIRESLPYLRNMMLMNEGIINPVLQQKSYQNPYDNFNTDFSIQSALNDSDRSTLTAMADERGNPSVRSARLAQIAANATAAKAPLYTQKYNVENQLENQKQVGQSQYLNQWEDTNRGLRKDFEHEVLQTREVQRQQKAMAIDNMMNTFLRKQEEDQALKLALANTNWDWNKYKQELVNNPEKAKAQFKYLEAMYKMQGGQDNLSKLAPPGYELEQSYKLVKKKSPQPSET